MHVFLRGQLNRVCKNARLAATACGRGTFVLCVGIPIDILLSILNYFEIRARSCAVGTWAHVKVATWGMTSNGIGNII